MRHSRWPGILVGTGATWMCVAGAGASEIQWVESYAEAKKTARQRNTLMMVDFHADW